MGNVEEEERVAEKPHPSGMERHPVEAVVEEDVVVAVRVDDGELKAEGDGLQGEAAEAAVAENAPADVGFEDWKTTKFGFRNCEF